MTKISTQTIDGATAAAQAWLDSQMKRMRAVGRFADFAEVTPAMAALLLAGNDGNRAVVRSGVKEWSDTLRRGDWEANGEPIIVASTGELNDGQHRLSAVIETGITLPTLIVFGVSRESRMTVDTGKKRTAGHVLGMAGIAQASLTAAGLKVVINLEGGGAVNSHRTAKEIERAHEMHPGIRGSLQRGRSVASQFRQSTGLFVALHYLMAKKSQRAADEFFDMLADGTAPAKNHPTAAMRARLTKNLAEKAKLPITEVAALMIKAWCAFREGRSVNALRWRSEGDAAETFPRIK